MKKKFGIIGNHKSLLSPILHNYWFNKYSIDANYSIIQTTDEDLENIVKRIKDGSLSELMLLCHLSKNY